MSTKETISSTQIQRNDEEKEIYFMVLAPKEKEEIEKENLKKIKFKSENKPRIIYEKEIKIENESYLKHKVFKLNIKNEKKIEIEYSIEDDIYNISFTLEENIFIYDVKLTKKDRYIDNILEENIDQNKIPYYNKLQIFLDALKENNETNKNEQLYKETISLFKEKKDFNLLIFLFIHVYENNNLCPILLKIFNKIEVLESTKTDKNLSGYLETFNKIFSNDDFIRTKKYDMFDFYGIIICYLHYYDAKNKYFSANINKLYKSSEENAEIIYKILIKFHKYFIKPLNQDIEFYNNFLGYVINTMDKKDKKTIEKVLKYIKDIETFLNIINKYRDDIIRYFIKKKKKIMN